MFGFLIKKAFFDLWDNFLPAVLMNLGFIALLAIPVTLPATLAPFSTALALGVMVAGALVVIVYAGLVFGLARHITNFESLEWNMVLPALRAAWKPGLFVGVIGLLHAFLLSIAFPVYTAFNNALGLFALALLFWMSVLWWITVPWFFPVVQRLNAAPATALKKSFILTFDNTGLTVGLTIGALIIALLSFLTAFLLPGIAGLAIWYQTALRLRMYKYDYIEEHPEADRREIPWDALLVDDRERVGKRSLRGMIFPWKD